MIPSNPNPSEEFIKITISQKSYADDNFSRYNASRLKTARRVPEDFLVMLCELRFRQNYGLVLLMQIVLLYVS